MIDGTLFRRGLHAGLTTRSYNLVLRLGLSLL